MSNQIVEIERRFWAREIPLSIRNGDILGVHRIVQHYLKIQENGNTRIRQKYSLEEEHIGKMCEYTMTTKAHVGPSRERVEIEFPITMGAFTELLTSTLLQYTPIVKNRYLSSFGTDKIWELDEFFSEHEGLFIFEIELKTVDELVIIPEELKQYIIREVTDEPDFANVALAQEKTPWTYKR